MNAVEWLLYAAAWEVWHRPSKDVDYDVIVAAAMIVGRRRG